MVEKPPKIILDHLLFHLRNLVMGAVCLEFAVVGTVLHLKSQDRDLDHIIHVLI